jgi:hypothetical protein
VQIKAGEEHPGLVPLRLFGTVSEEEVEAALLTAFSSPSTDEDKDKRKGGKRAVTVSLVNQALNKLDGLLRDPNLHLFRVRCIARLTWLMMGSSLGLFVSLSVVLLQVSLLMVMIIHMRSWQSCG